MVQLVVYNQSNGDSSYLDLGDVSIKADYSSIEIQDISKRKSESTQAFTLPFTDTNNSFFSHFYNVNASGDFDSNSKVKASILVDSIEVLDGYLQLLKVDANTENYDVVVMGEVANIVKSLGTSQLNDLDFSAFNHVWSKYNIERSWNEDILYTDSSSGSEILYPLIDYGYGINEESVAGQNNNYISFDRLKPSIKVKTVFFKILENLGYTISSTFLGQDFFGKQYMTIANDVQQLAVGEPDYFLAKQFFSGNIFPQQETTLSFNSVTSNIYNNYVSSIQSPPNRYEVPITGYYKFRVELRMTHGLYPDVDYLLRGKVGSNTIFEKSFRNSVNYTTDSIALDSADAVTWTVRTKFGTGGPATYTGLVQLMEAPASQLGTTVDLSVGNSIMPKEKQSDFISSILSRYNLVVVSDKDNPNELIIEPAQTYFEAGTSKDWTDKLDASKNIVIKPTSEYQTKQLFLSDLESDDKQNKEHQEQLGVPYNSYTVDFDNDFAQDGKTEIKSIFSSYTNEYFSPVLLGQAFAYDGETPTFVKTKPKLFAYSGKRDAVYYVKEHQLDTSHVEMDEYPLCSTYLIAGDEIESTDKDIRFRSIPKFGELNILSTPTIDDTFARCWKSYLNNLYGTDARILIANFNLNSVDIANFNYNDKIFVKDAYYRINKIKGFSLGQDISTQVELIKILEGERESKFIGCGLIENGVNDDGFVEWIDSDGNPQPPTRKCCEGNGYVIGNYNGVLVCYAGKSRSVKSVQHTTTTTQDGTTTIGRSGSRISIEGTISKLGEDALDGQILSWSNATDSTRWITFPDEIPLDDGKILIGDANNVATKSTLQGDANISVTTDDAGGTTTIGTSNDITVSGDITAANFIGDGSQLTNIPTTASSGTTGKVQLSDGSGGFTHNTNLIYSGSTLSTVNINAGGDVSANTFTGNGANLTGLPASGSNTHVQFNDVGSLSGYSTFTFNKYSGELKAPRYLGENISGSVYQDSSGYSAMYLTPDDFRPTNNTTYSGFISNNGGRMGWGSTSYTHYATFQVPKGYNVTGIDLKGSANYTFYVYASTWSSGTATYKVSGTINTALTLLSYQQLIGNSGDYFTIRFQPSSYGNYIYGCKLLLYPT